MMRAAWMLRIMESESNCERYGSLCAGATGICIVARGERMGRVES